MSSFTSPAANSRQWAQKSLPLARAGGLEIIEPIMLLSVGFDLCLQVVLADHADKLLDDLPVFEKKERWDRADVVLCGNGAVFIDVDFADLDVAVELASELF